MKKKNQQDQKHSPPSRGNKKVADSRSNFADAVSINVEEITRIFVIFLTEGFYRPIQGKIGTICDTMKRGIKEGDRTIHVYVTVHSKIRRKLAIVKQEMNLHTMKIKNRHFIDFAIFTRQNMFFITV